MLGWILKYILMDSRMHLGSAQLYCHFNSEQVLGCMLGWILKYIFNSKQL